ncbi:RICIN domain-containing protein [Streptomyces mirabilis]|uniref:RICIN domain-containing protein n=1 Tax=Streptomyces mirabilis TaxID=68239 RepID=UPI003692D053
MHRAITRRRSRGLTAAAPAFRLRSFATAATAVALLGSALSTATSASAAEFPPAGAFTIKAVMEDGRTLCLSTTSPSYAQGVPAYRACDPQDMAQRWSRPRSDADDYGIVYANDGRCLVGRGLYPATSCALAENVGLARVRQESDGLVVDKRGEYWSHSGGATAIPTLNTNIFRDRADHITIEPLV